MSFYQLIANQLSQSGLDYEKQQLEQTDIIEYMVLESAGALHPLQGKPLKCFFRPGDKGTLHLEDDKKHSSLEFGLVPSLQKPSISEKEQTQFIQIVNAIEHKFPESSSYSKPLSYKHSGIRYGVILPDENIEQAIKSSSLFMAAGDLSALDLDSLLLLRKKLNLYKVADDNISELAERLVDKVNIHLSKHFDPTLIQQALPKAERKFVAMLAIAREEHKFNQLLQMLNYKLFELTHKGTKAYESGASDDLPVVNNDFDPNYSKVAPIAQLLRSSLVGAGADFFNNPMSQDSYKEFKSTCYKSIKGAKDEFGQFRGWAKWYNELNPILKSIIACVKALGGVIAGLTIVPGLLTEIYSEQGYVGTFFNTKTDSLRKLETFEKNLFCNGGLFDELDKEIPHLGVTI